MDRTSDSKIAEIGIRKVNGPYKTATGGWAVDIFLRDGKQVKRTYSTEAAAKAGVTKIDRKSGQIAKTVANRRGIEQPDGSLQWWRNTLSALAYTVAGGGDVEARHDLKAISDAARSYKTLYDMAEVERKVAELERHMAEHLRARKHGIAIAGSVGGLEVDPGGSE